MRLAVLGATGSTGRHVTEQALARGHEVTAIVRNSLAAKKGFRVAVGDVCKPEELIPAFAGQDAVISCLGQRKGGNPWIVRDAAVATLQAMQQSGLARLVIVSGALLYPSWNPLVLLLKQVMADRLTDGRAAEAAVTESSAKWTIVRPPRLQEGNESKGYRIDTQPQMMRSLRFGDLAACLLDLSEGEGFLREIVGVSSR